MLANSITVVLTRSPNTGVVTEPARQLQERIVTVPRPPAPDTRARQGGGGDRATDASESGIGADGGEGEVYRDAAMYVVEQWGSMPRSVVRVLLHSYYT